MKTKALLKIILVLVIITAVIFIGAGIISTHHSDTIKPSGGNSENSTGADTPHEKKFTGLDGVEKLCNVTGFFTYGTSFCLSGSFIASEGKTVADVYIILSQAYDSKNLSSES